jgi:hypothetical protein
MSAESHGCWHCVTRALYPRAVAQWHWLFDKTQCREGEAPAEPHRYRERFFDPRCAAKRWQTLTARTSVQRLGRSLARPRVPDTSNSGRLGSVCKRFDVFFWQAVKQQLRSREDNACGGIDIHCMSCDGGV